MKLLVDAWYNLIQGVGDVYKEDVPAAHEGNFIVIRGEGGTFNRDNKSRTVYEGVVIIDIVTQFNNNVDRSVVEGISDTIEDLVFPSPTENGLTFPTGYQFLSVHGDFTYIEEKTENKVIYRKVTRYIQRISKQEN